MDIINSMFQGLRLAIPPWHDCHDRHEDDWDWRFRQVPHVENAMQTNEPIDIFKERLKAARALRGLNQAELAARAGLPPASVSHFESGPRKPSFDNLKALATALDVTTDYLLGRADTPEASAATVGRLHRDLGKLTEQDLKLATEFVDLLVRRGVKEGE
ncbi:helix-turn-helix transcriptional regulator [Bradyrhizobium sp. 155]|uniref:helix-turn-helix domain-containing protein n=1 Tax=Bradyrhizobium sp. 155 TaxID=2782629 RepID=UPI001FFFBCFF|nr:helix-turn-helix transcriptional regulator [Bradyrhizobium sp. 155]